MTSRAAAISCILNELGRLVLPKVGTLPTAHAPNNECYVNLCEHELTPCQDVACGLPGWTVGRSRLSTCRPGTYGDPRQRLNPDRNVQSGTTAPRQHLREIALSNP
jgi:hypothetical protein